MHTAASPLNTEGRWPANEAIEWHANQQRCTGKSRASHSPGGSILAEFRTIGFFVIIWAIGKSQRLVVFQ